MARINIEHVIDTKLTTPTYRAAWSPVMKVCRWWTAQRKNATLKNRREVGDAVWWSKLP